MPIKSMKFNDEIRKEIYLDLFDAPLTNEDLFTNRTDAPDCTDKQILYVADYEINSEYEINNATFH